MARWSGSRAPYQTRPTHGSSLVQATVICPGRGAIRLYQKLDLEAALAELSQAEVAAKDNEDETIKVLIYRGLIYSETARPAEANDQFKRALAIRPWAEVPEGTSPRIAKVFADARKSLWGMASVKPPQKRVAAPAPQPPASSLAPDAQPGSDKK